MNLTALQNSPFLQSLGWAIANSLWQAAIVWIAYHLVNGVYKNASAKFKNNLSTVLLSAVFVWFCVTLFNKYFAIENLPGNYDVPVLTVNNIDASTTSFNWKDFLNEFTWVLPYLSVAYLFLLIFLSLRLINVYRFTRFIKYNGLQKPGVEWKLFTEKVARHMGISKKIKLWVSNHIDVPATIGFLKPVILIPLASVNRLSEDQMEAIILHELSHIKRNDYLINLFISIIETLLFFNPFVVLLARIIKRERENCCDDFVIQYQYDRYDYASALLSLEQSRTIDLRLAIGATSGKKQLLLRVKRIMEVNSNTNFNYGQKLLALLLITGIICSVAWLSPENKGNQNLQAIKKTDNSFERKIKNEEKPEIVTVKQNDNKVKSIFVKSQSKKTCPSTAYELNALKDLNLQEIANAELKRVNGMFSESKKEITRKKIGKLNLNKFLFAPATAYASSGNGMSAMHLYQAAIENATFNHQNLHDLDAQKIMEAWDKLKSQYNQFSFSFDSDEMQDAMNKAFNSKQFQSLLHLPKNIKDADIEKLIRNGIEKSNDKNLKRIRINQIPKVASIPSNESFYVVETAPEVDSKLITEKTKQPGRVSKSSATDEDVNTQYPNANSYAYTYDYGNSNNENNTTRFFSRVIAKSNIPGEKQVSVTPEIAGKTYRIISNGNNSPKTNVPKPPVKHKDNIRIEYKNGVVIIDGEKVILPDQAELLSK